MVDGHTKQNKTTQPRHPCRQRQHAARRTRPRRRHHRGPEYLHTCTARPSAAQSSSRRSRILRRPPSERGFRGFGRRPPPASEPIHVAADPRPRHTFTRTHADTATPGVRRTNRSHDRIGGDAVFPASQPASQPACHMNDHAIPRPSHFPSCLTKHPCAPLRLVGGMRDLRTDGCAQKYDDAKAPDVCNPSPLAPLACSTTPPSVRPSVHPLVHPTPERPFSSAATCPASMRSFRISSTPEEVIGHSTQCRYPRPRRAKTTAMAAAAKIKNKNTRDRSHPPTPTERVREELRQKNVVPVVEWCGVLWGRGRRQTGRRRTALSSGAGWLAWLAGWLWGSGSLSPTTPPATGHRKESWNERTNGRTDERTNGRRVQARTDTLVHAASLTPVRAPMSRHPRAEIHSTLARDPGGLRWDGMRCDTMRCETNPRLRPHRCSIYHSGFSFGTNSGNWRQSIQLALISPVAVSRADRVGFPRSQKLRSPRSGGDRSIGRLDTLHRFSRWLATPRLSARLRLPDLAEHALSEFCLHLGPPFVAGPTHARTHDIGDWMVSSVGRRAAVGGITSPRHVNRPAGLTRLSALAFPLLPPPRPIAIHGCYRTTTYIPPLTYAGYREGRRGSKGKKKIEKEGEKKATLRFARDAPITDPPVPSPLLGPPPLSNKKGKNSNPKRRETKEKKKKERKKQQQQMSVLHDYVEEEKKKPWEEKSRLFGDGIRCYLLGAVSAAVSRWSSGRNVRGQVVRGVAFIPQPTSHTYPSNLS